MSLKPRISCSVHDQQFRFQRSKFDFLLQLWYSRGRCTLIIFPQISTQCCVDLLEVHSDGAWRGRSWVVTLVIWHYVLVTIIWVWVKDRFNACIIKLIFRLEILARSIRMPVIILVIQWHFQVAFDIIHKLVLIRHIVCINTGSWLRKTVMMMWLHVTVVIVCSQFIVSFEDYHRLKISCLQSAGCLILAFLLISLVLGILLVPSLLLQLLFLYHKLESILVVLLIHDMCLPTMSHSAKVFLDFNVVSQLNSLFQWLNKCGFLAWHRLLIYQLHIVRGLT